MILSRMALSGSSIIFTGGQNGIPSGVSYIQHGFSSDSRLSRREDSILFFGQRVYIGTKKKKRFNRDNNLSLR
jgi:hypothetical protein